jgi:hypothetical protein
MSNPFIGMIDQAEIVRAMRLGKRPFGSSLSPLRNILIGCVFEPYIQNASFVSILPNLNYCHSEQNGCFGFGRSFSIFSSTLIS